MKKTKVICAGEALIDRIFKSSDQEFKDFLGGAPANVSCALRKLNIDSAFIGSLGNDEFGKKFIKQFEKLKVDVDFLQCHDDLPTRVVKVKRDDSGDRYFSSFNSTSKTVFADEALDKNLMVQNVKSLEKLFSESRYFVVGTILLSSPISTESITFLISLANRFNVKIIVDLNWREVFWEHSKFSSDISKKERFNLIRQFLNHAHILKMAKEEAILFFENENPSEISEMIFNQPDVIITDGPNPISWFINGLQGTYEVQNSTKIIDTTGAGDAFLAGLISKLIFFDHSLDKTEIHNCIKFASVCGLITCLGEGAIEQQPDYAKVNDFLGSQI